MRALRYFFSKGNSVSGQGIGAINHRIDFIVTSTLGGEWFSRHVTLRDRTTSLVKD